MFAYHPLASPSQIYGPSRSSMGSAMGDGFFGDLFNFLKNAVTGLWDMIGAAIQSVVMVVAKIVDFIKNVIGAVLGQVSWDQVFSSLGKVFQEMGNLLIILNPARYIQKLMLTSELTRHTFMELDHFLGGMITNLTNLSDVALRAMRGDPISSAELLKDVLAALQVVAIIVGGPMALGAILGADVGREVCKHQSMDQTTCVSIFTLLGTAVGGYVGDALTSAPSLEQVPENQANLQVEDQIAQHSFSDYLSDTGQTYLEKKLSDDATKLAVSLCRAGQWVGDKECSLLGKIAQDYINSPEDQDWEDFLANEAAKLGVAAILVSAFPPGSKAQVALTRAIPKPMPTRTNPNPRTLVPKLDKYGRPMFDANGNPIMTAGSSGLANFLLIGAAAVGGVMMFGGKDA